MMNHAPRVYHTPPEIARARSRMISALEEAMGSLNIAIEYLDGSNTDAENMVGDLQDMIAEMRHELAELEREEQE